MKITVLITTRPKEKWMLSFKKYLRPRWITIVFLICSALILGNGLCQALLAATPTDMEKEVLKLINAERAKNGLHALAWNDQLFEAARLHSEDMEKNNYLEHVSLDGRTPGQRAAAAGYNGPIWENIGEGQTTAQAIFDGWMNSTGHHENILNTTVCDAGVGHASDQIVNYQNNDYSDYWTLDLGKQRGVNQCPDVEDDDGSDNSGDDDAVDDNSGGDDSVDDNSGSDDSVDDGSGSNTTDNQAPIAKAGKPQIVKPGSQVTLDGSQSSDPDGDTITYRWEQRKGVAVDLDDSTSATPTFVAPTENTILVFNLVVNDGIQDSKPVKVFIVVNSNGSWWSHGRTHGRHSHRCIK